jgi:hypothetical protein
VAIRDLVEVRGDDAFLARLARERLGQLGCLDDLLGLARVDVRARLEQVLGQQTSPHQLLGDARGTAPVGGIGQVGDGREHRGLEVEALVLPEGPVLHRGRGVEDELGDLVVRDDVAALAQEGGEEMLARTVVDLGGLGEGQRLELLDIRQVPIEGRDEARRGAAHGDDHGTRDPHHDEQEQGEHESEHTATASLT